MRRTARPCLLLAAARPRRHLRSSDAYTTTLTRPWVAGPGPVQRMSVPVGVQADQVERDGGVDVLQPGLGQAAIAGAARSGHRDGLGDGALDAGPGGVTGPPVGGGLLGAGGGLGLVDLAGAHSELAAVPG